MAPPRDKHKYRLQRDFPYPSREEDNYRPNYKTPAVRNEDPPAPSRPASRPSRNRSQSVNPSSTGANTTPVANLRGRILFSSPRRPTPSPISTPGRPSRTAYTSHASRSPSPTPSSAPSSDHLPHYWTDAEEETMHRTARNFDLIMNYARDCEGGERWSTQDIAEIRDVGKNIHSDRRALNEARVELATADEEDKAALAKIVADKDRLLHYCEQLNKHVLWLEKRPLHHLLNSGECEIVDGMVYRRSRPAEELPTTRTLGRQNQSNTPYDNGRLETDTRKTKDVRGVKKSSFQIDQEPRTPSQTSLSNPTQSPYRHAKKGKVVQDSHKRDAIEVDGLEDDELVRAAKRLKVSRDYARSGDRRKGRYSSPPPSPPARLRRPYEVDMERSATPLRY